MIKIWEYSSHVLHSAPDQSMDCQCQKYLNMCIDAARDAWDTENYVNLTLHCIGFNFIEKNMWV